MQPFDNDDRALEMYFADLTASPTTPLSRQREAELSTRIQHGDLEARDELVRANLRFVIDVAKKYEHRGLSLGELISAGNLGLITAAERFDGTKGFKFISYAVWWIRQSISQTIADQGRTVRLPMNRLALLRDIGRASQRLGQRGERAPDVEDLAAEVGVSANEVAETLLNARRVRSLDALRDEDDDRSLLDILIDPTQESPDDGVVRDSARSQLDSLLNSLDERERRIVRLYYGLDGNEMLTLEQIGGPLNITRERVRQLKDQALSRLRDPSRAPTPPEGLGKQQGGQQGA
jgi:RNA polymerase primary sigma factor